jgi:hypothetical protein
MAPQPSEEISDQAGIMWHLVQSEHGGKPQGKATNHRNVLLVHELGNPDSNFRRVPPDMHTRRLYMHSLKREDCAWARTGGDLSVRVKSDKQLARVATNLAIGVAGLILVRLITQFLPMFHDAGWIVEDKLTVQAGVVIAVDALLLSVLVRFAIEIRAYLALRLPAISSLGNMAASLICLLITAIAYTDFKPVTHAWPEISDVYLWTFFAIAVVLLIGIVILIFRDRDSIAAIILRQPMPNPSSKQHADTEHSAGAVSER